MLLLAVTISDNKSSIIFVYLPYTLLICNTFDKTQVYINPSLNFQHISNRANIPIPKKHLTPPTRSVTLRKKQQSQRYASFNIKQNNK